MISNVNLLISGRLLRYGSTRAPPARMSSVEMLSSIFRSTGNSIWSGISSILGIDAIFGPFFKSTDFACSYGRGSSSKFIRSEEHTSELQSRFDLVCRLLLEKKKNKYVHDLSPV